MRGGSAAPPGQPLCCEGHITGKVEEGDIPDLTQHELMLHFFYKKGYLNIENYSFITGIFLVASKVGVDKSHLKAPAASCMVLRWFSSVNQLSSADKCPCRTGAVSCGRNRSSVLCCETAPLQWDRFRRVMNMLPLGVQSLSVL